MKVKMKENLGSEIDQFCFDAEIMQMVYIQSREQWACTTEKIMYEALEYSSEATLG